MAAVPSIGRATRVEGSEPREAELTRSLYEEHAGPIFRYCLRQLGSREEAEDAVQSTFLNAFRGLQRGVVPELESAWLFKIAHNVCLSRRRSSWRRGRIESPTEFALVEEVAPATPRVADELIGLQDVLERMPESQRRAILLREWQGLSYREIAAELDLSQSAVETLIFRARRSLAAGLEEPPQPRRRVARAADLGNVLAGLKSLLLGGGAAAKVAATVAVVGATTVVAAAPVRHDRPAPKPRPAKPASVAPAVQPRPASPRSAGHAPPTRPRPRPAAAARGHLRTLPPQAATAARQAPRTLPAKALAAPGRAVGHATKSVRIAAPQGKALAKGHAKPAPAASHGRVAPKPRPAPPARAHAGGNGKGKGKGRTR